MDIVGLLVGLILAAICYFVAALFLPHIVAILIALLVLVVCVFGGVGGRFTSRW